MKKKEAAFYKALNGNKEEIKENRINVIFDETKTLYKRHIEDHLNIKEKIQNKLSDRLDIFDLDCDGVTRSKDFRADMFVKDDIELLIRLENVNFTLNVIKDRYEHLFGEAI